VTLFRIVTQYHEQVLDLPVSNIIEVQRGFKLFSFYAYNVETLRRLGGVGEAGRLDRGLRGVGAV
jgi:hypothetical protein